MLDVALRAIALVSCVVIALSFALFAAEQASDGSQAQVSAVVDPGVSAERQREALGHTKAREIIDDFDDVLLRPFAAPLSTDDIWVKRGVPTGLGLLVYGFLLLFLARMTKIRSKPRLHRHREPAPSAPGPSGSAPPPGGPDA